MPTRHAILGPSGARKWITCAPSARFEEQIVEAESIFAREGTLCHDLGSLILEYWTGLLTEREYVLALNVICENVDAFYKEHGVALGVDVPEEGRDAMYGYAIDYAQFVRDLGGEIWVEREYDLSQFVPLGFGTSDATNLFPDVIIVTDLKYGKGVAVSAVENWQAMLYALGALLEAIKRGYKPETVIINIYQPRVNDMPSTWAISVKDLLYWAETIVAPAGALAIAGQGDFVPGKHCIFCKARTVCKAYFDEFNEVLRVKDKRVMSLGDLAYVLEHGPALVKWYPKVEEDAIRKLQTNICIPGFKLVKGKGRRTCHNEDDVIDLLVGEGYDTLDMFKVELKGVTDLEKLVGKPRFEELLAPLYPKAEGNPQIASADDTREAIDGSLADAYDNEDLT